MNIHYCRIEKSTPTFAVKMYESKGDKDYRTNLQVYFTSQLFDGFWLIIWF